jgi:hypothetical protein
LTGNSTSSIMDYFGPSTSQYPSFAFAASPEYEALSEYTTSTSMFSNVNSVDCGVFTSCYLKPQGCKGTYTGKAKVTASAPFGLEVT